jgi:ankyrin repeat protein
MRRNTNILLLLGGILAASGFLFWVRHPTPVDGGKTYQQTTNAFPSLAALPASAITNADMQAYLKWIRNDPNRISVRGRGWTTLMSEAALGNSDRVRLLLAMGADPNLRGRDGETALMLAAAHSDSATNIVRMLLDHGAEVNAESDDGDTAMERARIHSSTAIVQMLKAAGGVSRPSSSSGSSASGSAPER